MGTWKLYEINGTQETLIVSYPSNTLNQQFNNPKPIETKDYRISFTDNDGCTGSETFTIPGCAPADCIVLTSSDVLEINNETNTITVNYEGASNSYIYFDGPSQDSLSFKVKCDGIYINENRLGGLIVWQVHGDSIDNDWPMITEMHKGLHP